MAGNKNSGRRPQPTALKVLRGNPSKTPLNEREPKPPEGPVERPAYLSASGVIVWEEEAPAALAMGTLTTADRRAFATMCELVAIFQANATKDEPSSVTAVATANSLKAYFDYFGLNPSGRSRIKIPTPEPVISKWAGVLG